MSLEALIETGVRLAVREAVFFESSFSERCNVLYQEDFDTACWMYQPPHVVVIGLKILDPRRLQHGLSEASLLRYVANFYHHEMAHARFTCRDSERVVLALQEACVPFRVYNIFEDARAERLYSLTTGRAFNWTSYERAVPHETAEQLFFALIQSEGRLVESDVEASAVSLFRRVRNYYDETLRVTSFEGLLPVLRRWVREFPRPPSDGCRFGGDLELAYASAEEQAAFLATCMTAGSATSSAIRPGVAGKGAGKEALLLGAGSVRMNSLPNKRRSEELAKLLSRAFNSQLTRSLTAQPGKKLSVKHYIRGDRQFYRKPRELPGRPERVLLILDCSGSMNGKPLDEARILLSALSSLAEKRLVHVKVLLSGTLAGVPSWQLLELPMSDAELASVHACASGEALQATVLANLRNIEQADRVLVYTDAELTDEAVDKGLLHKHGAYTTGLYVGNPVRREILEKYFDRAIVRSSIEELALILVNGQP